MSNMKKIITVLLSVLLIAGLFTGCNGESVEELFRGSTPTPTPTPEPVETVVISFDANGGTVTRAMDSITIEKGSEVNLPDVTGAFEAPYGYQFASCWNTKADGSGTSYNATTPAYTFEDNVTLYAQWSPVPFKFVVTEVETVGTPVKILLGDNPFYAGDPIALVYSKDGESFDEYTIGNSIELSNVGDEVYFKAATSSGNAAFTDSEWHSYTFSIQNGKANAVGNIMFLLDETGKSLKVEERAFCSLFSGCVNLTSVPMLPATELAKSCYWQMFLSCTGLTNLPAGLLPTKELSDQCYYFMFNGCTSLKTAPELPATTLQRSCYDGMFSGCTTLTQAPELPAEILTMGCYGHMFENCAMLNSVTMLATNIDAFSCLNSWLNYTASSGTLYVKDASMQAVLDSDTYRPVGWTVVVNP